MRYPACRFSFDLLAFLLVWPVRSANVFTVQLCVSFLACAHTHVCTHTLGRTIEHPNIPLSNLSLAHVAHLSAYRGRLPPYCLVTSKRYLSNIKPSSCDTPSCMLTLTSALHRYPVASAPATSPHVARPQFHPARILLITVPLRLSLFPCPVGQSFLRFKVGLYLQQWLRLEKSRQCAAGTSWVCGEPVLLFAISGRSQPKLKCLPKSGSRLVRFIRLYRAH